MGNISAAQREPHAKFATLKRRMKKKKLADNVLLLIGGQKVMTDSPISKNQLIAIEMRPTSAEKTELVVRFNRPFTTAEMNAMHRGLNLYLVGTPDETKPPLGQEPWRCSLPVITVQMLGDFGQEGFFEKTDEPVHGVPGVGWSQAAVDFACLIQGRRAEEPACEHNNQRQGERGPPYCADCGA